MKRLILTNDELIKSSDEPILEELDISLFKEEYQQLFEECEIVVYVYNNLTQIMKNETNTSESRFFGTVYFGEQTMFVSDKLNLVVDSSQNWRIIDSEISELNGRLIEKDKLKENSFNVIYLSA